MMNMYNISTTDRHIYNFSRKKEIGKEIGKRGDGQAVPGKTVHAEREQVFMCFRLKQK